jgi:hypothetical protein
MLHVGPPDHEARLLLPHFLEHSGQPPKTDHVKLKIQKALARVCDIFPASKYAPFVVSALGCKNARSRIVCLEELSRVLSLLPPERWRSAGLTAASLTPSASGASGSNNTNKDAGLARVVRLLDASETVLEVRTAALDVCVAAYRCLQYDKQRLFRALGGAASLSDRASTTITERLKHVTVSHAAAVAAVVPSTSATDDTAPRAGGGAKPAPLTPPVGKPLGFDAVDAARAAGATTPTGSSPQLRLHLSDDSTIPLPAAGDGHCGAGSDDDDDLFTFRPDTVRKERAGDGGAERTFRSALSLAASASATATSSGAESVVAPPPPSASAPEGTSEERTPSHTTVAAQVKGSDHVEGVDDDGAKRDDMWATTFAHIEAMLALDSAAASRDGDETQSDGDMETMKHGKEAIKSMHQRIKLLQSAIKSNMQAAPSDSAAAATEPDQLTRANTASELRRWVRELPVVLDQLTRAFDKALVCGRSSTDRMEPNLMSLIMTMWNALVRVPAISASLDVSQCAAICDRTAGLIIDPRLRSGPLCELKVHANNAHESSDETRAVLLCKLANVVSKFLVRGPSRANVLAALASLLTRALFDPKEDGVDHATADADADGDHGDPRQPRGKVEVWIKFVRTPQYEGGSYGRLTPIELKHIETAVRALYAGWKKAGSLQECDSFSRIKYFLLQLCQLHHVNPDALCVAFVDDGAPATSCVLFDAFSMLEAGRTMGAKGKQEAGGAMGPKEKQELQQLLQQVATSSKGSSALRELSCYLDSHEGAERELHTNALLLPAVSAPLREYVLDGLRGLKPKLDTAGHDTDSGGASGAAASRAGSVTGIVGGGGRGAHSAASADDIQIGDENATQCSAAAPGANLPASASVAGGASQRASRLAEIRSKLSEIAARNPSSSEARNPSSERALQAFNQM